MRRQRRLRKIWHQHTLVTSARIPLIAAVCLFVIYNSSSSSLAGVPSPQTEEHPLAIGHRGASGYAPENTLASYRIAVSLHADYIEIDLQMTEDGELVAMHDDTVDRTTNGSGKVRHMTLAEVKALDAGSKFNALNPAYAKAEFVGEKVPTLREIFDAFGDSTKYMLETKIPSDNPGLEDKLWALVRSRGLENRIAVQSFSKASLLRMRSFDNDVPLYQLLWYTRRAAPLSGRTLSDIASYADGVGANFSRIDEKYIWKVRRAGLKMLPYTINTRSGMRRALAWGASGLHTDYPDRLKEVAP
ncbi:glycerophosphodiester phosphodiesterase family protein [Cohnella soli]|uniref:Glycerophosphodiester phosphodiesterase family protein n=1 Tax=Cohnella soli TaxID=425005 RepID=A0ABW0HZG5_9BACL